jgi:hypothetical protein
MKGRWHCDAKRFSHLLLLIPMNMPGYDKPGLILIHELSNSLAATMIHWLGMKWIATLVSETKGGLMRDQEIHVIREHWWFMEIVNPIET